MEIANNILRWLIDQDRKIVQEFPNSKIAQV